MTVDAYNQGVRAGADDQGARGGAARERGVRQAGPRLVPAARLRRRLWRLASAAVVTQQQHWAGGRAGTCSACGLTRGPRCGGGACGGTAGGRNAGGHRCSGCNRCAGRDQRRRCSGCGRRAGGGHRRRGCNRCTGGTACAVRLLPSPRADGWANAGSQPRSEMKCK